MDPILAGARSKTPFQQVLIMFYLDLSGSRYRLQSCSLRSAAERASRRCERPSGAALMDPKAYFAQWQQASQAQAAAEEAKSLGRCWPKRMGPKRDQSLYMTVGEHPEKPWLTT